MSHLLCHRPPSVAGPLLRQSRSTTRSSRRGGGAAGTPLPPPCVLFPRAKHLATTTTTWAAAHWRTTATTATTTTATPGAAPTTKPHPPLNAAFRRRRPAATQRRYRPSVVATAAPPDNQTASHRAIVVEYLLLLNARPDVDPDDVHEAVEAVWSLQYMVPGAGVVCASAGRVLLAGAACDSSNQASIATSPFTHLVYFRLSNRAALDRFVSHPLFAQTLEAALGPVVVVTGAAGGYAELVFEGSVDRALEPMFRRGPDYEPGGVEQLWLLAGADGGKDDDYTDADAFLARLGELAESSAAGALQATYGRVMAASPAAPEITHVMMARFSGLPQAAAFAALPPCAAISGGCGGGDGDGRALLPLLARRRLLVRAGKLDGEEEDEDDE